MTYIIVSIVAGLLFAVMDGIINANPYAQKLGEAYRPIAKTETEMNIPAGIAIDLIYGFVMAGFFLVLYDALPGDSGILKGLSYAGIMWFFRVVMWAATTWMTLKVSIKYVVYMVVAGLVEMAALGLLFGLTLNS